MSQTLLDRAREVLANHRTAATALAMAVPLAATAAANADIVTFSLGGSVHQYNIDNGYGGFWNDANGSSPNVAAAGLVDGLKIYGTGLEPNSDSGNRALTILGGNYGGVANNDGSSSRIVITGGALLDNFAWDSAVYSIPTTFDFGFAHSGGTLDVTSVSTSFQAFDSSNQQVAHVGSSGFSALGLEPGGNGWGFQYVDNFSDNPIISALQWAVIIEFHWSGFGLDDTLGLDIPSNSIDINIVPAPSAAALAGLGLLAAARRKR
jgi:hypothetical protein